MFDQFSSSNGGSCDTEGIRRFWDRMLQRLKIHAETGELEAMYASGSEKVQHAQSMPTKSKLRDEITDDPEAA